MKSVNFNQLVLSLCLLAAVSCKKNSNKADQNSQTRELSEYLGEPIIVDLRGKVLGTNQQPIENAVVSVGDITTLTDSLGHFIITNVSAHENLLTINVTKKDYKTDLINLTPKDGTNTVTITLYKESELSIFWFNKNNHNLPHTSAK